MTAFNLLITILPDVILPSFSSDWRCMVMQR